MTSTENKTKIPAPLYAAAGVGDLAYQQLRKLPERVAEFRERVVTGESDLRHDVEKLRDRARRNAKAVVDNMQAAQDRAANFYHDLVVRGEHVVRGARAPIHVKAEIKSTTRGESAEVKIEHEKPEPEAKAEAPKPVKRTTGRPTAAK